MGINVGSDSINDNASSDLTKLGSVLSANEGGGARVSAVSGNAGIDAAELHRKLAQALGKEIERNEVELRMTPEGFVISLHEMGFFDSGQATLQSGGSDKIKRIAAVLSQFGLDMRVEGHSDNVPIHNDIFASNWELSTARATTVAMMLIEEAGIDPKRMAIAGYAQYHPAASNDTPEGRRANRRVDIVVVSIWRSPEDKTPQPAGAKVK